jgi:hypothetical protein
VVVAVVIKVAVAPVVRIVKAETKFFSPEATIARRVDVAQDARKVSARPLTRIVTNVDAAVTSDKSVSFTVVVWTPATFVIVIAVLVTFPVAPPTSVTPLGLGT